MSQATYGTSNCYGTLCGVIAQTKVGIVGLGGVADRIHIPACLGVPGLTIAAACDLSEESRRRMSAKYTLKAVFPTLEEMLEKARPDFVIVGTPPGSHFEICSKAMDAGVHVFCEKPFMPTLDEADRIIEIARARNLLLRVNNQYRYMSVYAEASRRLAAGEFGRLFYVQMWQHMFHPPAKETNWRNQLKNYVLYEFGTHALDLACFFFDSLPDSILAHIPRARPEFDADILVHLTLRFPGERLAAFSFNRVSHAPEKYLESRLDCENASLRISLGGVARWSVEWSRSAGVPVFKAGLLKGGQVRVERNGGSRALYSSRRGEFATATARHLKVFLEEMRHSPRPLTSALHAREVLRLVFSGYESAESGEVVRFRR